MTEQKNGINRAVRAYVDTTLAALDYKADILESILYDFREEARELRNVRQMVEAGETVPPEVWGELGMISHDG